MLFVYLQLRSDQQFGDPDEALDARYVIEGMDLSKLASELHIQSPSVKCRAVQILIGRLACIARQLRVAFQSIGYSQSEPAHHS